VPPPRLPSKLPLGGGNFGILTTAGNLLFTGDQYGNFIAFDPKRGGILWHTRLDAPVSNGPMACQLDGREYVVVGAGDSLFAFTVNSQTVPVPRGR
jgi:glucose dehydrogenase